MNFAKLIIDQRLLFVSVAVALSVAGLLAWNSMPKEEDPRLKERNGILTILYPGGSPRDIERLIVKPVEDELAGVAEIKHFTASIRRDVAVFSIELRDSVSEQSDINEAWRDISAAVDRARLEWPDGARPPELNRSLFDLDAAVLSISGESMDLLELRAIAVELKDELLKQSLVADVRLFGEPERIVSVAVDDRRMAALGLNYDQLARTLQFSNQALPAGALRIGDRLTGVNANASFANLEDLRRLPIGFPNGETRALGDFARVELGARNPPSNLMFRNGKAAMGLGVVARENIDLGKFGDQVRETLARFDDALRKRPERRDIRTSIVAFQPDYVRSRLDSLAWNLAGSMGIVAAVVILGMGLRAGALTALIVPAIASVALFFYAAGGGVLHQIAVAAFVLSLGILIDNVIVIVESIQERLDAGLSAYDAASGAVREFALPLASSTGTTVAAFLPMLGSAGSVADFTRAIPLIAVLTLIVSYFFAVLVTPPIAMKYLKPGTARTWTALESVGARLGALAAQKPARILALAALGVVITSSGFTLVDKRFFPGADRNQVLIDLRLPQGTPIQSTVASAARLEARLRADARIASTAHFAGRSAPQFYYNLIRAEQSPHVAQLLLELKNSADAPAISALAIDLGRELTPEAQIVARQLEQGPPSAAPIEVRLTGENLAQLADASDLVLKVLRETPGADVVRHDMGPGAVNLRFEIGDANALQRGLARSSVVGALLGRTRGLPAGQYRAGDEALPIELTSLEGEDLPVDRLKRAYVARPAETELSVADLAAARVELQPAAINLRNRERTATLLAETTAGHNAATALADFRRRLAAVELPAGVRVAYGGEAERSGDANTAILQAMPAGVALFLIAILMEFRSFKKLLIILITIPLAVTGVTPGLLLSGQPFGFTALLGMLALTGIVVNNGILLIDAMDRARAEGQSLEAAAMVAVQKRLRPILLTTLTTTLGLLPLAFSSATLWPPFAWALMSGLALSAGLTLLVIPSVYCLIFRAPRVAGKAPTAIAALFFASAVVLAVTPRSALFAQSAGDPEDNAAGAPGADAPPTVSLAQALELAGTSPTVAAAMQEAEAREYEAEAFRRSVMYPGIGASFTYEMRDRELTPRSGLNQILPGAVSGQRRNVPQGGLEITQPIYDPENQTYLAPANAERARAARLRALRVREEALAAAAGVYLDALELRVRRAALATYAASLQRRRAEVRRLYELGFVPEADLIRIGIALDDVRRSLAALNDQTPVVELALGRALGRSERVQPARLPAENAAADRVAAEPDVDGEPRRADLRALELQIRAKERELEALQFPFLPSVFARGQWVYQDNGQLTENNWFSLSFGVRLPLFEAGARGLRRDALASEIAALRNSLLDAQRGVDVQIALARARRAEMERNLRDRVAAVQKANRNLALESERYRTGRTTLSALLDAEDLLRTERERLELAPIALRRANIQLSLAIGGVAADDAELAP